MAKKILNFKKRLEDALYDPLERLTKELYIEGVTEEDLWSTMIELGLYIPDTVRMKLANYLRDQIKN
jgi:hypothetical protein